jgi:hypothetical protein
MSTHREPIVREVLAACLADDVDVLARRMAGGFSFSSPPDPLLDREAYLERCWPNGGRITGRDRAADRGGRRGRRHLRGDARRRRALSQHRGDDASGGRIAHQEVCFGWDL